MVHHPGIDACLSASLGAAGFTENAMLSKSERFSRTKSVASRAARLWGGSPPLPAPPTKSEAVGPGASGLAPGSPAQVLDATELIRQAGYVLLEEISRDVHGTLFKARDARGELVSVRKLNGAFDAGGVRNVAKLEKKLTSLKHRAIVPILKLIVEPAPSNGVVAIVSEYVGDPAAEEWRAGRGPIDPRAVAQLSLALAEALEHAERQGVIHGLLALGRIRIACDGTPRISDFGMALLGCRPNTADVAARALAAPELLAAGRAQPATSSDVYSLGVLLCWLLTGAFPAGPGEVSASPSRQGERARDRDQFWKAAGDELSSLPIDPQVPAELQSICLKALKRDPAARYSRAAKLAEDLRRFLGQKPAGGFGQKARKTAPPSPSSP
jgi:serine/threonine protein kinase